MKNIIKTVIIIIVIAVVVLGGGMLIKKVKSREANMPPAKAYDVVVSTQQVKSNKVQLTLPYLAMVQNDKDVKISSKIPTRVNYVKPSGSKVSKGEVIVRLDNTEIIGNTKSINAQLEALDTTIKNMEATHQRTLKILEVKGASIEQSQKEENKLSELYSKKEALVQKLKVVQNTMGYASIKSPVSGIISKTMVNIGDMAMPGHPIANLKADNGFYLLVRVPTELNVQGIRVNDQQFEALPLNSTFNGLAEYKAYVDMPHITSGDRVEVEVVLFDGQGILLPFDAVINRNGKSFVLIREESKAVPQEVSILESGEQGILIRNQELVEKEIVVAKQDILLKLLSGVSLKVKQ